MCRKGGVKFAGEIKVFQKLDDFEPSDGSLLIVSPISRITGERLPVELIAEKAKDKSLIIFDAAQSFPDIDFDPDVADIVLGTSSKHFGSGPVVGFAIVSEKLAEQIIDDIPHSKEALASFYAALIDYEKNGKANKAERQIKIDHLCSSLEGLNINYKRSEYFVTLDLDSSQISFLEALGLNVENSGLSKYTLFDAGSILRISITHQTKTEEIDRLVSVISLVRTIAHFPTAILSKKLILIDAGKQGSTIYGNALNYGLQILASIAKELGFEVRTFHMDNNSEEEIIREISKGCIVGFSSTSPGHKRAIDFARRIKSKFGQSVLTIKGGVHETYAADLQKNLTYPIDFSFLGETENSFRRFLETVLSSFKDFPSFSYDKIYNSLESIEGVSYKGRLKASFSQRLPPQDFRLPKPADLEIAPSFSIFGEPGQMTRVMTMRGCPLSCTFCAIPKETSRLSVARLFDYLEKVFSYWAAKGKEIQHIFFEDATFTIDNHPNPRIREQVIHESGSNWLGEFGIRMSEFSERTGVKFAIQTRADTLDERIIDTLISAGLAGVYIGVESFDDIILRRIAKSSHAEVTRNAIEMLLERGINVSTSLTIAPNEEASALRTLGELMDLDVHEVFTEYLKVFPNTPDSIKFEKVQKFSVVDPYNRGELNFASPNPEDRAGIIVDRKGKLIPDSELAALTFPFYSRAEDIAREKGYLVNGGHFQKLKVTRLNQPEPNRLKLVG